MPSNERSSIKYREKNQAPTTKGKDESLSLLYFSNSPPRISCWSGDQQRRRDQLKNTMGGRYDDEMAGCSTSANCVKTTYNSTTRQWEDHAAGTVSCSGSKTCGSSGNGVTCTDTDGTSASSTCPSRSHLA